MQNSSQQSNILQDSDLMEQSSKSKEPSKMLGKLLKELNLPIEYPDYSSVDYWNSRYARSLGKSFEWLQPYQQLKPFIHKFLQNRFETSQILYAGCGNSQLAVQMSQDGIKNISCVDFSDSLIRQMLHSTIPYFLMDVTQNIEFEDQYFDLIIDKGLLDSIMCGEQFFERIQQYLNECRRILKSKGALMILSYGHPDTRLIYLKQFNVNIQEIKKLKIEQFEDFDVHYLYICTQQQY